MQRFDHRASGLQDRTPINNSARNSRLFVDCMASLILSAQLFRVGDRTLSDDLKCGLQKVSDVISGK